MVSSGGNVIIWCYHVMLSSGMITHPFFIFPENFTHSFLLLCVIGKFFTYSLAGGGRKAANFHNCKKHGLLYLIMFHTQARASCSGRIHSTYQDNLYYKHLGHSVCRRVISHSDAKHCFMHYVSFVIIKLTKETTRNWVGEGGREGVLQIGRDSNLRNIQIHSAVALLNCMISGTLFREVFSICISIISRYAAKSGAGSAQRPIKSIKIGCANTGRTRGKNPLVLKCLQLQTLLMHGLI